MRSLPPFRSQDQHPGRHADFFAVLFGLGRDHQIDAYSTTSAKLVAMLRSASMIGA